MTIIICNSPLVAKTVKAKGRPMLPAAFNFQIEKKEKPWENRAAVLPWFWMIRSACSLQTSFRGRRLEKTEKPKEKAIKGGVKRHLRSPVQLKC
jgi:hypothetical protein